MLDGNAGARVRLPQMPGDLVYFTMRTADARRAQTFYGGVLGWEFGPGNVPGGSQITNSSPPGGVFDGGGTAAPEVYFGVEDIHAAVERVRELGGEAEEPQEIASGHMARCRDDQGAPFNLCAAAADR
jgi:predicted enzyme related to lactoylglutathione lyase